MTRVLLIAADEADRTRIRGLLRAASGEPIALDLAGDYRQAVALAARTSYGAVVLDSIADLDRPLDLLRQVVADGALSGPFLVLLPTADRLVERAAIEAGAADALPKDALTVPLLERAIRYAVASRAADQRLSELALFDPATGLARQPLFWEILSLAVKRARRNRDYLAVLMLHVEGLAQLSDRLEPSLRHRVARALAGRLTALLRASDTVARFDTGQLVILIESMPQVEDIQVVVEKIIDTIAAPFADAGPEFTLSTSIGVSLFPTDALSPEQLIRNATDAMVYARERGENLFQFA